MNDLNHTEAISVIKELLPDLFDVVGSIFPYLLYFKDTDICSQALLINYASYQVMHGKNSWQNILAVNIEDTNECIKIHLIFTIGDSVDNKVFSFFSGRLIMSKDLNLSDKSCATLYNMNITISYIMDKIHKYALEKEYDREAIMRRWTIVNIIE